MFNQTLGLFDHHLGDLHVARRRFVEGRAYDLAVHRALHIGDLFGSLVNEEDNQNNLLVVVRDGLGNILQHHGLPRSRSSHDQPSLPLPDRGQEIDDTGGILIRDAFQAQPVIRIKRS